jgi:uncharacterized protein (TIGR03437 family)
VVAVVTATLASTSGGSVPVPMSNVMGALPDGKSAAIAGSGGTISVNAANPVPTISTLSPASATAGVAAFTLTVNGTGFVSGSVVKWNGSSRTTTFLSATQVQAAILATDIATPGTGQATVFNPTPGGGTSGNSAFTINAPIPVSFVQATANAASSSANTFSLSFASNTAAGDLILVGFVFNSNANFSSISDSQGNLFAEVGSQLTSPGAHRSRVYYANNIKGGADTVTINLSANVIALEVYLTEYSGVNQVTSIDAQAGASGAGGAVSSGNATTNVAGDMIYGYCVGDNACTAGSGFTSRSAFNNNLIEDMKGGSPGVYAATGTANNGWTMQMVALEPASASAHAVALTASASSLVVGGGTSGGVSPRATDPHAQPASLPQDPLLDLSCTPKAINAGSQATCKLQVVANPTPGQIRVTSTSQQVKTPTVVQARANQTSLTFQVSADARARQQVVTVTASAGSAPVQDSIQVTAVSRPILTVPDTQIVKHGTPVRLVLSAVDPADLPVQLAASDIPAGASFDAASGRFEWTPGATQIGKHQITFTATNAAGQSSSARLAIAVSSGTPILEAAEQTCSPGAVGSLRGSWLSEPGSALSDPSGNAMDLAGTKVKVNGEYVPILLASPAHVLFLCPVLDPETAMQVAVETAQGLAGPLSMVMQSASPWIFSLDASGQNQGLVSFAETSELAMARNPQVAAHTTQPGDEVLIWGSGFGSPTEVSIRSISVTVGGVNVEAESIRAVPGHAGVYTVQVRVPALTIFGDAVPVQVQATTLDGKQFISNTVTVAVERVDQ